MKLKNKFQRSKSFPEIIYSKTIPNKLLIENEDGRIYLYNGKVDEKAQRMERAMKAIASFSRLDNAKVALQKMEFERIQTLLETRKVQSWLQEKSLQKAA